MSKKQIVRFLKKVTVYNLFMATVVTFATLYICYRAGDISSGTVTALCGLWSFELGLSALIKVTENKIVKKEKEDDITV